ncbi:hypothetical protein OV079_10170 [Nannocystis pusilla]|uniref:Uncharacterized protein n=1 Tax=Nannocystis pusilla TaxID=889268 RepID=A0A9X3EMI9_9BACT|nr:hypothetical protein [Nannocystis pusilla]MCY1005925.1 hypothetical protein [Nannocystis pusilla]
MVAALPQARRIALAALILAPAIPLATVAARAIAGVVVAYPAALWAAAPAVLAAAILPLVRRTWSQGLVLAPWSSGHSRPGPGAPASRRPGPTRAARRGAGRSSASTRSRPPRS